MSQTEALGGETQTADPTPVQDSLPGIETTPVEVEVQPEAPAPPPVEYLEIDDASRAKHVKVKVDGQDVDVSLDEALQGYSRQADYTRKTAELAEQRREAEEAMQVQQALQANPGLTMQVLASRAGMSVEQYLGMQSQQAAQPVAPEPEFTDPLERELYETRQQMQGLQQQFQDQQADQRLRTVVSGLKEQYGIDDAEARHVVRTTAGMNLGIDSVPMVYRAMAFDKLNAQQGAVADAAAQAATAEQQRQAAAAAAQQVVAPSQVSANGVTQAAPSHQVTSTREALEMAFDELDAKSRR